MVREFSALECAKMFNVDLAVTCPEIANVKMRHSDAPYATNDCQVPLWHIRKRVRKSKRVRPAYDDSIKAGITSEPPGKGRVADLVRWYAEHANKEESAFEV